ncbi:putative Pectinesterase-2 precursor [Tripterygium wilfordii]|uniref:pectinesterase n=1 Tax=Tripterygium wilfordii TaxID=458696 RepID=A0A7J7D0V0_TRIWF|nr:putative Pectinesterase-2 precursor [Tripterygium wilfordii]
MSGEFKTVQAAIDSIPPNNNKWIRIQINPGIYIEQVTIPQDKPCIILEGQDRSVTTITYDAHDRTDTSVTFSTNPDYVVVRGITFENSYNRPLKSNTDITQAVAAQIGGDKNVFFECGFVGLQDTLWDFQGRHYFYNCYIEGADCYLNVTAGLLPDQLGYITAQDRESPEEGSGFVFPRGIVDGSGQVYLGRACGPYSRVIFDETNLTSVVYPTGWDAWYFIGQE